MKKRITAVAVALIMIICLPNVFITTNNGGTRPRPPIGMNSIPLVDNIVSINT